jgi:hypothetical protein
MKTRDDEIELQRKLEEEKKRALELQRRLDNAKALKAAIKLQSAWRSKVARRVGLEHMRAERLWRRAEASRKKRQEELQKDYKYRARKIKESFVRGLNVALHEKNNAERLPGTVSLKPQKARVKCTDDLSELLKPGDRLLLKGCQNYVKIKRVKKRERKNKNTPAWSEIFLTRPWDGVFDSKQIEGKFIETDEDGDVKKLSNVIVFKLPSMNMEQRVIASAVRTVGHSVESLKARMSNITSKATKGIEELKKRNKTFARVADSMHLFRRKKKDAEKQKNEEEKWIEMWDETSQQSYYINSITNESVWEKPPVEVKMKAKKRRGFLSRIGIMLMSTSTLKKNVEKEEEEEKKDEISNEKNGEYDHNATFQYDGDEYYHHQEQQETTTAAATGEEYYPSSYEQYDEQQQYYE